ncbi:MAG TPA: glycosyltransferase [Acidimicrobiales bacterium]|nr:glycosyltransferase [Acidimicrobiales bacterium]
MSRVRIDGKQFASGAERFAFRGVSYGTFAPRQDEAQFPEREQVKQDFAAMREADFTVVRTYTPPPPDVVDLAADWGLKLLVGAFFPDWRYLVGAGRRDRARLARAARAEVRQVARRLAESDAVLGISLGNEVPADVVRWEGARRVADLINGLTATVHDEDPEVLVTYANYPTAEYLELDSLDFVTFNVFLEQRQALRRYLTRLQHLAGDRPLVLGEIGLHAPDGPDGERQQAESIDWQLQVAAEAGVAGTSLFSWTDDWWVGGQQVEGWRFGLTRADRSPRPALGVAAEWNGRELSDLRDQWPTMSVVICAYNAAPTLDECLTHTCALDYPGLDIVVVDDGSTDETAEIARRHPRARLVSVPHAGLSVARNAGLDAATGEIVAYLDSDAYPTPEWPYYVALAFEDRDVSAVGGPNWPPPTDPVGAQQVSRAPGGPVHVLLGDDRAEHIPGCNMAYRREALIEVAGFDPIYTAAGDDVDLCWRILDRGRHIGFHPAALVWHHARPGVRRYLRQQRGYGRAEALVAARHPDRFTGTGSARWMGRIYRAAGPPSGRQRVYRGAYGSAAFQSVYRSGGHGLDLAHQVGVPVAVPLLATAVLGVVDLPLAVPAVLAAVFLLTLAGIDAVRQHPPRRLSRGRLRFRLVVALLNLLQPLARSWGRLRAAPDAHRDLPLPRALPGPVTRAKRGVLLLPAYRPRPEVAADIVTVLRRAGLRVETPTGWEDHDADIRPSVFVRGEVVTSAYPEGTIQVRFRIRPRLAMMALVVLAAGGSVALSIPLASAILGACVAETGRGLWRTARTSRSAVAAAVSTPVS